METTPDSDNPPAGRGNDLERNAWKAKPPTITESVINSKGNEMCTEKAEAPPARLCPVGTGLRLRTGPCAPAGRRDGEYAGTEGGRAWESLL